MTTTKKTLLAIVLIALAAVVVVTWRVASYRPLSRAASSSVPSDPASALGYPWRGAIHVHTTFSDGAGDVDEVAAAAAEAGLDFLVVTDHNPMRREQRPEDGWRGSVFVIFAEEISTDRGHLLALDVPPHAFRFGPTARQAFADIREAGGWALVAHPEHLREPWQGAWGGAAGLEVANLSSAWSHTSVLGGAATVLASWVDRDYAALRLVGAPGRSLQLWDALTALPSNDDRLPRPRVAIGAADAHGPVVGVLDTPGYADTLAVLNTLVWLPEPPSPQARRPRRRLLDALRSGRAAVELTAPGDARGFEFTATAGGTGRPAVMGEMVAAEAGPWTLRAAIDADGPFEIVVRRNGSVVASSATSPLELVVPEPGTYRAEIRRPGVAPRQAAADALPWVVGNPIYVWPAAARAAARVQPVPPLPAPPETRDLLAGAEFEANQSGATQNDTDSRNRGLRWDFELAADGGDESFAALAWRLESPQDWSDSDGVAIDLASPGILRVELQVRTQSADGARELWSYSVRTGRSSIEAVPWSRFQRPLGDLEAAGRSAGERPRVAADSLRRVTGVFLQVTPAMLARPDGRVWLRELGLYGAGQR